MEQQTLLVVSALPTWITEQLSVMTGQVIQVLFSETTDGGTNWFSQSSGTTAHLSDACFVDDINGWVVGSKGTILRTNDGGTNWALQSSGITKELVSVSFSDSNNGTVVGFGELDESIILRTTNGGTTWGLQQSEANHWLLAVSFIDANNGTTVGGDGTILHTTNGGVTFVEEEQIDEVPREFLLSQNYPNPFNPTTKLSYSITQSGLVTLKVYDVLGTEIETLVNEEKSVGTYELNWNAANLPSGVYFYRLQAGSFVQTRKMILLK